MRQFRQHGAGDHDPVIHPGKQPDGFDRNQIAKRPGIGNDEDHFCGRDASDCLSICRFLKRKWPPGFVPGEDAGEEEWSLPALGAAAIASALLEPAPALNWDGDRARRLYEGLSSLAVPSAHPS